jgi:hypothetical protein
MLRKMAALIVVLAVGTGGLMADPQEKKKTSKKAPADGIKAKVVKVDAEKKTLTVTVDGATKDYTVTDDTKFFGPQGGKVDMKLKDDRLIAGAQITLVVAGKNVKELWLPRRGSAGDKSKKKIEDKSKKKTDDKSKKKDADKQDKA